VFLARKHEDARVLLTTFSETLANALRARLRRLIGNEPRLGERLEVHSMRSLAMRLYEANFGKVDLATEEEIRGLLQEAAGSLENQRFSRGFLWAEWADVVDAWQLETWEDYRDVRRLGRKTRLAEKQRAQLWTVFERVRARLRAAERRTEPEVYARLAEHAEKAKHPAFEFAVVDEAQDIGVVELRFLAGMGGDRPNSLFFAGDLGQRIFQQPFSWKSMGVDIRGRSRTLKINYRTSHQIRMQADRLLGPEIADVDGVTEDRRGTVSVFNGPPPVIQVVDDEEAERETIVAQLGKWREEGLAPHEIALFVRSDEQIPRAESAAEEAGISYQVVGDRMETVQGKLSVCTMHRAKGLEFRAVIVAAVDDEVVPLQERIESVADEADLEDVYQTERHLLYVACTRARDHLMIVGVDPASEFLDDLEERAK
jgi:superfamily I DNA/RNA helicase